MIETEYSLFTTLIFTKKIDILNRLNVALFRMREKKEFISLALKINVSTESSSILHETLAAIYIYIIKRV